MSLEKSSSFIAMLYLTTLLMSIVLVNKAYSLFSFPMSVSAFIWPVWFVINTVSAVLYGYRFCQRLFYYAIFCSVIFIVGINLFVALSVPSYYAHLSSYQFVFGGIDVYFIAFLVGFILGNALNAYIGSHWKALSKVRWNWLRVILASAPGQSIFVLVVTVMMLFQDVPIVIIIHSFLAMFFVVMIMTGVLSYPAGILITVLKLMNNNRN